MYKNDKSVFYKNPLQKICLTIVFAIGLLNISCNKNGSSSNDQYYIKYEVNSSSIYSGGTLKVVLIGEGNLTKNFTINTNSSWETIIGPVKRGFIANLSVSEIITSNGRLTLQTKISASKNGSAFALKQNDDIVTPRKTAQLTYTIDY
jgi:hypothetical protein